MGLMLVFMILFFYIQTQDHVFLQLAVWIETFMDFDWLRNQLTSVELVFNQRVISIQKLGYGQFIAFFINKFVDFLCFVGITWSAFHYLKRTLRPRVYPGLLSLLVSLGIMLVHMLIQGWLGASYAFPEEVIIASAGALTGLILAWV